MPRTQHPIHPDFKAWSRVNPPIVKPLLPIIQRLMGVQYRLQRSTPALTVTRLHIPTGSGGSIRALWYAPVDLAAPAPALVVYHGGGFVFPAAPYHYRLTREYAARARCNALFVEYRLAPGHPYPAAPEDCYAAYHWLLSHAAQLGVDPSRIAVTGDSAGGELAAVICLMAKDRGLPIPRAQMLLYPVVGADADTASMWEFTDTPLCNSQDIGKYDRLYHPTPTVGNPAYAAPMRAESLAGMPEAYIETAEFDCLRDGGALYAQRLRREGAPVELNETKGTIHGFDIVQNSDITRACVDRRVAFLRRALGQAE